VGTFLDQLAGINNLGQGMESDRSTRWIKEGRHLMNQDEGSYTLSHT